MSIPARYFYMLSWPHMDDTNGVMPHDAFFFKTQIFPGDSIDVAALIEEAIAQHRLFPFEAGGKRWLWCPTFRKHQTINHPSNRKYPDPPKQLQEDYRSGKLALTQSRESRVERVEKEPGLTPADAALKDIYETRKINVYQILNKFKKGLKAKKITMLGADYKLPDEVILATCAGFKKYDGKIRRDYPWFLKVLGQELERWWVAKQDKEHQEQKADSWTSRGGVSAIQEVVRRMMPGMKEDQKT